MPESLRKRLIKPVTSLIGDMGGLMILLVQSFVLAFRKPFKLRDILKQMEFIGVDSVLVVVITGTFTGAVLALQSYYGFRKFGAEGLVGATVALSMTRELGPVLTSLMVTGRAGSAMAAELGSMRVTEQIDALVVMALNPVKYLIVPRVVASLIMLPILTIISDFVGIVGGYLVGVKLLGINEGAFISKIIKHVEFEDIYNGLIKAAVFGIILSVASCYKGFYTKGGAEGVGRSTTEAVVLSSVTILIVDYLLTSLLF
jgi:phospholipid/cholesterol/gamma-HCH transport system permease protein